MARTKLAPDKTQDVFVIKAVEHLTTGTSRPVWLVSRWNADRREIDELAAYSRDDAISHARQWATIQGCHAWLVEADASETQIDTDGTV